MTRRITAYTLIGIGIVALALSAVLIPVHNAVILFIGVPIRVDSFGKIFVAGILFLMLGVMTLLFPWHRLSGSETVPQRTEAVWMAVLAGGAFVWFTFFTCCKFFMLRLGYFDLGLFTNAVWNTFHEHFLYDSSRSMSMMQDHFNPILTIVYPLVRLFPSAATVITLQMLLVSLAVPAVYLTARTITRNPYAALLVAVLFLISPYLHLNLATPYLPVGFSIVFLSWALYFLASERMIPFFALLAAALTAKEDVVFAAAGILLYVILFKKEWRIHAFIALVLVAALAVFIARIGAGTAHAERFIFLKGATFPDKVLYMLSHPADVARAFLSGVKIGNLLFLFMSVFFLALAAPRQSLLYILPLLFFTASDWPTMYGLRGQYSSVILPGLFYAAAAGFVSIRDRLSAYAPAAAAAGVLFVIAMLTQYPPYNLYLEKDILRDFYAAKARIDDRCTLSVSSALHAHFATRDDIAVFPELRNAKQIIISADEAGHHVPLLADAVKKGYTLVYPGKFYRVYERP